MDVGTLLVVSTPIGNPDDISIRAIKALKACDIVVCEEYNEGAKLLHALEIECTLMQLNEHSNASDVADIIQCVKDGKIVALISDAGTPLVADPGQGLVQTCIADGINVEVVPGASSILVAAVRSGFDCSAFLFAGFVRRTEEERIADFKRLAQIEQTIILLEAPYRLRQFLTSAASVMPQRKAYVGCSLTMPAESHHYGTLQELADKFTEKTFKGEFVVCIQGTTAAEHFAEDNMTEYGYMPDDERQPLTNDTALIRSNPRKKHSQQMGYGNGTRKPGPQRNQRNSDRKQGGQDSNRRQDRNPNSRSSDNGSRLDRSDRNQGNGRPHRNGPNDGSRQDGGQQRRGFSDRGPRQEGGERRGFSDRGPRQEGGERRGFSDRGPRQEGGQQRRGYSDRGPRQEGGQQRRGFSDRAPRNDGQQGAGYSDRSPRSRGPQDRQDRFQNDRQPRSNANAYGTDSPRGGGRTNSGPRTGNGRHNNNGERIGRSSNGMRGGSGGRNAGRPGAASRGSGYGNNRNGGVGAARRNESREEGRAKVYTSDTRMVRENLDERKPTERKMRSRRNNSSDGSTSE